MKTVLKSKRVSYGTVVLYDDGASLMGPRYHIEVNGTVKEYSDDLNCITGIFDRNYY